MDWSEPYLKLEQSHKSLKDALNQERYEDAEELTYSIAESLYNLQAFIGDKIDDQRTKLSGCAAVRLECSVRHSNYEAEEEMEDREFLIWLHERMTDVHGEDPCKDYMHKLRAIIKATPPNKRTPNMGTGNSMADLRKMIA